MLLRKFAEYLKTQPDSRAFHIVRLQSGGEDEPSGPAPAEPTISSAKIVEGDGEMRSRQVGAPLAPRFTHFLDGTQRTQVPCYFEMVPVLYGFTGAVIRKRGSDRLMSTFDKLTQENLYCPHSHVDCSGLLRFGVPVRDVDKWDKGKLEPNSAHPAQIRLAAQQAVSNDRAKLEYALADAWTKSSSGDEWLLWDGSITGSVKTQASSRMVGVIKSHQTQYFPTVDQAKILSLKVGERSSVFQPTSKGWSPVYSWYLRLHPNEGRDMYFGLIRVEAAASPDTIDLADEISRWLLGERAPLSLPDSRWDRMIYPIRDCEQYLRSIAPSKVMLEAALSGL